jgi:hypothetical protein
METNFESIPVSIVVYILSFLDYKDILSFRSTCKKNKRICFNKNVIQKWKSFYKKKKISFFGVVQKDIRQYTK